MSKTLYRTLASAANGSHDLPAAVIGEFNDIPPGTMALLTLLRSAKGKPDMIHVAWQTMGHGQPGDVIAIDDAERCLRIA